MKQERGTALPFFTPQLEAGFRDLTIKTREKLKAIPGVAKMSERISQTLAKAGKVEAQPRPKGAKRALALGVMAAEVALTIASVSYSGAELVHSFPYATGVKDFSDYQPLAYPAIQWLGERLAQADILAPPPVVAVTPELIPTLVPASSTAEPTSTSTFEPINTATPEPTATDEPTATPEPSLTPQPTPTPSEDLKFFLEVAKAEREEARYIVVDIVGGGRDVVSTLGDGTRDIEFDAIDTNGKKWVIAFYKPRFESGNNFPVPGRDCPKGPDGKRDLVGQKNVEIFAGKKWFDDERGYVYASVALCGSGQ